MEDEATPWKEQEGWEAEQLRHATMKVGAQDRKAAQEYDYVMDDPIEFIKDQVMAGGEVRPSLCSTVVQALCIPPVFWRETLILAGKVRNGMLRLLGDLRRMDLL